MSKYTAGQYDAMAWRISGDSLMDSEKSALADMFYAAAADLREREKPIPMILFCPICRTQHIDRAEVDVGQPNEPWTNPPHRSHLCHACGCLWRPADVPTTGVAKIETRGKADTFDASKAAKGGVTDSIAEQILRTYHGLPYDLRLLYFSPEEISHMRAALSAVLPMVGKVEVPDVLTDVRRRIANLKENPSRGDAVFRCGVNGAVDCALAIIDSVLTAAPNIR